MPITPPIFEPSTTISLSLGIGYDRDRLDQPVQPGQVGRKTTGLGLAKLLHGFHSIIFKTSFESRQITSRNHRSIGRQAGMRDREDSGNIISPVVRQSLKG